MSVLPKERLYPKKPVVILCFRNPFAILQHQLDYWFSKYPKGFYKFIEPCKHPLYKTGDSWTEEIGYSRPIFNKAFDLLGTRYKSKTEFMSAADKFQGKTYASYHDRKTNKTFFVKNQDKNVKKELTSSDLSQSYSLKNERKNKVTSSSNTLSRNETNNHSYGGTIGGKNKNSFTNNTSSSLAQKVEGKNSDTQAASKKIAEEIKNIWIEEIGELEINHLSSTLVSRINHSYSTIFNKSLENWRTYCRKIASSQFLMGEKKGTNFKAKLSWAIQRETYERIQVGDFTLGDRLTHKTEKIIAFSSEDEKTLSENFVNSSKNPLWIKAGLELLKRVGGYTFKQWFNELDIDSCQGNEIHLKTPSLFHRDYINRNYRDQLISALEKVLDIKVIHLSYSV